MVLWELFLVRMATQRNTMSTATLWGQFLYKGAILFATEVLTIDVRLYPRRDKLIRHMADERLCISKLFLGSFTSNGRFLKAYRQISRIFSLICLMFISENLFFVKEIYGMWKERRRKKDGREKENGGGERVIIAELMAINHLQNVLNFPRYRH